MSKYILTRPGLRSSANILAKELGLDLSYTPLREAPVIRWGISSGHYEQDTRFNSPDLIVKSRRDLLAGTLHTAGIACIRYHAWAEKPEKFPIVARTVVAGMRGDGIIVVQDLEQYQKTEAAIWSYWETFEYELGVHIFDGKVVKTMKKMWTGEDKETEFPIRNSQNGYHFKNIRPEVFQKLHPFIAKFYEEFPIGMARLDVAWSPERKSYVIIECNTAPSLSENQNTAAMYVENLRKIIPD